MFSLLLLTLWKEPGMSQKKIFA